MHEAADLRVASKLQQQQQQVAGLRGPSELTPDTDGSKSTPSRPLNAVRLTSLAAVLHLSE